MSTTGQAEQVGENALIANEKLTISPDSCYAFQTTQAACTEKGRFFFPPAPHPTTTQSWQQKYRGPEELPSHKDPAGEMGFLASLCFLRLTDSLPLQLLSPYSFLPCDHSAPSAAVLFYS
ncbi:unnamed protein product [Caretta caretta]